MKPLYLRTKLRDDAERLNRTANECRDYWLLGAGIIMAVIAWLIARAV